MVKRNIKKEFKKIRLLVLDFDGVMTNNKVYVDDRGREMVCCSRGDGLGVEMVKEIGVNVIVITREKSRVAQARCTKLGIEYLRDIRDKLKTLKDVLKKKNIQKNHVCYVGNDITDADCVRYVGIGVAVNDSCKDLLTVADYITPSSGGDGAVRDVCRQILHPGAKANR